MSFRIRNIHGVPIFCSIVDVSAALSLSTLFIIELSLHPGKGCLISTTTIALPLLCSGVTQDGRGEFSPPWELQ